MALPYTPHSHAVDRAVERFGIERKHAKNWFNQVLANSVKAYVQPDGRQVFQHRTKEIFLAVDMKDMLVVTIIDKPIEKVKVRSPFLDAMLPQMERELHKMKRDYTRKRRSLEKLHAEKVTELGLTLENRARVCNPKTQATIAKKAKEIEQEIKAYEAELAQMKQDYEIAEVKVACFIRSCRDEIQN